MRKNGTASRRLLLHNHSGVFWVQTALNAVLVGTAFALAVADNPRFLIAALALPALFAPFSFARWRLQRVMERHFAITDWRQPISLALLAGGALFDAVMVAQLLTARSTGEQWLLRNHVVSWVGPVWFSAHVLLAGGYLAAAAARRIGTRLRRWTTNGSGSAGPESPERREFLQRASVAGAGLPFVLSLSNVPLSYDFRVDEHEITLPNWPPELDGLRVVHLSDIHVGGAMDRSRLLRVAELTNSCRPEIVLHTGDFLTHRSGDFDAPLYEALAQIRAPYGQWGSLGNHDFEEPERLVRRLNDAGVSVLRNRLATVTLRGKDVELGGLDFIFHRLNQTQRYEDVIRSWGKRSNLPRILLNHDPGGFYEVSENCADLVLSGHTHGGQVGIQLGSGQAITVVALAGFPDQGVFHRGNMKMFVTRCVGFYGYPMRIGIPPEIALLILRSPTTSV